MATSIKSDERPRATLISAELFALAAGIIGLIVDVVGLVGIVGGFVSIPIGSFFADSPTAFAVITFFAVVYSIMLVLYFLLSRLRRSWRATKVVPAGVVEDRSLTAIAYLLWVPLFWLWTIAVWQIAIKSGAPPGIFILLGMFWFFAMVFGGELLCYIVKSIESVVHPDIDYDLINVRSKR